MTRFMRLVELCMSLHETIIASGSPERIGTVCRVDGVNVLANMRTFVRLRYRSAGEEAHFGRRLIA